MGPTDVSVSKPVADEPAEPCEDCHQWEIGDSAEDNLERIEITLVCNKCGATCTMVGDWELPED